ncbi:MAG: hypothetical protein R3F65_28515 [bacterium]
MAVFIVSSSGSGQQAYDATTSNPSQRPGGGEADDGADAAGDRAADEREPLGGHERVERPPGGDATAGGDREAQQREPQARARVGGVAQGTPQQDEQRDGVDADGDRRGDDEAVAAGALGEQPVDRQAGEQREAASSVGSPGVALGVEAARDEELARPRPQREAEQPGVAADLGELVGREAAAANPDDGRDLGMATVSATCA